MRLIEEIKNKKSTNVYNNFIDNETVTALFLIIIISYFCIFKTNFENNREELSTVILGCTLFFAPIIHYCIQKIQIFFIKKRFHNDEHIICHFKLFPSWWVYLFCPLIIGTSLGIIITVILFPDIEYRRLNHNNAYIALIAVICIIYLYYHLFLRAETILTNYGLRSSHKDDTLFQYVEDIEINKVDNEILSIKICKNNKFRTEYNKIPKIIICTNKEFDIYEYKKENSKCNNLLQEKITNLALIQNKEIILKTLNAYDKYKKGALNDK